MSLPIPWRVILDEYRQALQAGNRSPKTITGYLQNLRRFFLFLETTKRMKPMAELGRKEVREYTMHLNSRPRWPTNPYIRDENRKRLSPFSVRANIRDIKTFWSWMYTEEYIDKNPLARFPLPNVPDNLIKTVTPEQFQTFLSNIDKSTTKGLKYYCILLILYDTGIRISELTNIIQTNIDLQKRTIVVRGKGQRERLVWITPPTRNYIQRYLDKSRKETPLVNSPYLFANPDGGPISENTVQQFMRRLRARSGLEGVKFSPHIIRHSTATDLVANGGNPFYTKQILGHKHLTTTLKYTKLEAEDIQEHHARYSPVAKLFRKGRS